ncbi:class I SAM-dependent methyltransferase [Bermanella marisrubri]|uniref:class I SAM-dependent methyltransferase n=1 Tax=Bermanella marisrubri TaxID=207949 RepID=UPI001FB46BBF|nr:class I SAM-dependent methyltransferase [Bermanella marisrubri]
MFHEDANKRIQRPYYQCLQCQLVFVPESFFLSQSAEKAEYDLHRNHDNDSGYRQFLKRFSDPYEERLRQSFKHDSAEPLSLLEFGCGPGPVLAHMLEASGHHVTLYDAFYYPNLSVLADTDYHGISATEVIEHLHAPKDVFELWLGCLKPRGILGVMTKLVKDRAAFAQWHYKNDPTHVCFFSEATFAYLADQYGLHYEQVDRDVAIFCKF